MKSIGNADSDVLKALSQIIDPDFGTDIVTCGFIKDLRADEALGEVILRIEKFFCIDVIHFVF